MDITDIKPVTLKFAGNNPAKPGKFEPKPKAVGELRRFQPSVTVAILYRHRPIALEIRSIIYDRKISQLKAAEIIDINVKTFQRWIAPRRKGDCPKYILKKLKQELER